MEKKELTILEKLLQDDEVRGKQLLERFIWVNTTQPKYNIGDCYVISDLGHQVYEEPIINKKGRIINIESCSREKRYLYIFELEFETVDNKHIAVKCCIKEECISGEPVLDNHNIIGPANANYPESISINLGGQPAW